jgi:hypothetical protein
MEWMGKVDAMTLGAASAVEVAVNKARPARKERIHPPECYIIT